METNDYKTCPNCNLIFSADDELCPVCGIKLVLAGRNAQTVPSTFISTFRDASRDTALRDDEDDGSNIIDVTYSEGELYGGLMMQASMGKTPIGNVICNGKIHIYRDRIEIENTSRNNLVALAKNAMAKSSGQKYPVETFYFRDIVSAKRKGGGLYYYYITIIMNNGRAISFVPSFSGHNYDVVKLFDVIEPLIK